MVDSIRKCSEISKLRGGLVLEPKKGLYEGFVVEIDFNSLYPSLIRQFEVCFSTVKRNFVEMKSQPSFFNTGKREIVDVDDPDEFQNQNQEPNETDYLLRIHNKRITRDDEGVLKEVECTEAPILARILENLIKKRTALKKLILAKKSRNENPGSFVILEKAYKLLANSMYGCLGYARSRFYSPVIADTITGLGRYVLTLSKKTLESKGYQIIYGDTDSLMIHSKLSTIELVLDEARKIVNEVNELFALREVDSTENQGRVSYGDLSMASPEKKINESKNDNYQIGKKKQIVKVEINSIYKKFLLIKKKRYLGLKRKNLTLGSDSEDQEYGLEVKGLQVIRNDCCQLVKSLMTKLIFIILYEKDHKAKLQNFLVNFRGALNLFEKSFNFSEQNSGSQSQKESVLHRKIKINFETLNEVNMSDFTPETIVIEMNSFIMKNKLKRSVKKYLAGQKQPHVRVAEYLISQEQRSEQELLEKQIPFIISEDPSGLKMFCDRAMHPRELLVRQANIDIEWYLQKQVFTNVINTLGPIEGISVSFLKKSLGLGQMTKPFEFEKSYFKRRLKQFPMFFQNQINLFKVNYPELDDLFRVDCPNEECSGCPLSLLKCKISNEKFNFEELKLRCEMVFIRLFKEYNRSKRYLNFERKVAIDYLSNTESKNSAANEKYNVNIHLSRVENSFYVYFLILKFVILEKICKISFDFKIFVTQKYYKNSKYLTLQYLVEKIDFLIKKMKINNTNGEFFYFLFNL